MPATVIKGINVGKPGIPGGTPVFQGSFAAQAFAYGSVLVDSGSGTLQRGAADLTSGIVGIAIEPGAATAKNGAFVPALPHVVFEMFLEDFAAATSHVSLATDLYAAFALQRDVTNDRWLADENDVSNVAVRLLRFKDAVGTTPSRAYFAILNSATIYA